MKCLLPAIAVLLLAGSGAAQDGFEFSCSLDRPITLPDNWELSPDAVEEAFPAPDTLSRNVYFQRLTEAWDRAPFTRQPFFSYVDVDLTITDGEVTVEEAVVDFADGKLLGITLSIYNRATPGRSTPPSSPGGSN